jgi:dihydrofolate reductase
MLLRPGSSGRWAEVVAALKAETGKYIWLFRGGVLFGSLLDAQLVDTIEVGMMPILLGGGIPVLPTGLRLPALQLNRSKALPSGILMLEYKMRYHV